MHFDILKFTEIVKIASHQNFNNSRGIAMAPAKPMPLYTSPSFRHGLPESRLQGRFELAILGTRYPLPGGYDSIYV
jgi:hypothetical protein